MRSAVSSCSFLPVILELLLVPGSVRAQSVGPPASPPAPVVYSAAAETVLRGTITQVSTRPAPGLPLGLHLMVSTAQGPVDAHLGRFPAAAAEQKGWVPGVSITLVGVTVHLPAGEVFLVRTIAAGGQTTVVRNARGFPVRQVPPVQREVRGVDPKAGL